jgi:hypothetical protein
MESLTKATRLVTVEELIEIAKDKHNLYNEFYVNIHFICSKEHSYFIIRCFFFIKVYTDKSCGFVCCWLRNQESIQNYNTK